MIFKNPWFLLLVPAALAIGVFSRLSGNAGRASVKIPVELPERETLRTGLYRFLPFWSRMAAALLLIAALAGPQKISREDAPPSEGVDIIMCLDTSFSMAAEDFKPYNRLYAAKNAAADFVKKRRNDRIGVVIFGGVPVMTCPLTLDYQSVLEFLDSTYINMTGADGTAIGDAIMTAVNHLRNSKAKSKIIILLTDGRSNTGTISDPVLAAKTAEACGIKIYTIGTASKGKALIPTGNAFRPYMEIEDDLDEGTLMAVADTTGGEFNRATDYAGLRSIYDKINSLEKTKFETKSFSGTEDRYLPFLLPALGLLLMVFLLEKSYLRTIP